MSATLDDDLFTCMICMESFHKPQVMIPCMHRFCKGCVSKWLTDNTTCPMCRAEPSGTAPRGDRAFDRMLEIYLTLKPENKRSEDSILEQSTLASTFQNVRFTGTAPLSETEMQLKRELKERTEEMDRGKRNISIVERDIEKKRRSNGKESKRMATLSKMMVGQITRQEKELVQLRATRDQQETRIDEQSAEVARLLAQLDAEHARRRGAEAQVDWAVEAMTVAQEKLQETAVCCNDR